MRIPGGYTAHDHVKRQAQTDVPPTNHNTQTIVVAVVTITVTIASLILIYIALKAIRLRHENPRFVPTSFLQQKWRAWSANGRGARYSTQLQEEDDRPRLSRVDRSNRSSTMPSVEHVDESAEAGVDRNTSVRSVMTLPAYSSAARDNERILGRAGERAGIDTVLEFPETAEEEEESREEEMESLYQIRLQRRQEIAEREERRRLRREARIRGDRATLAALRHESIRRAEEAAETSAAAMIAEHQSRDRDRRVTSVSYADLGVARHDGTRVRANSSESDRAGLLDSAASIGGSSMRPWMTHHRTGSASSVLSMSTTASEDRAASDVELPPAHHPGSAVSSRPHSRTRSASHPPPPPPPLDTDPQPPQYDTMGWEEAPPYSSPVETRSPPPPQQSLGPPQLPHLERLPSIRITENTPVELRRFEFPAS
ncbi:hypothetical protein LTR28_009249 [Elasticomyces elasticus]|nr:hypothetical protein LTR28_009249 [Elasticomyces elasticus]